MPVTQKFISPPEMLQYFDFGFNEVMADTLWIRAIQDLDYCDSPETEKTCRGKSWLFKMLNVASDLSPKMEVIYSGGAIAISVLITDVEGASHLFEKGVRNITDDWVIPYRAGYHALYEEKKYEKAADYILMAARRGGPFWFYSLSQRLYLKEGKRDLGRAVLAELKTHMKTNGIDDPKFIQRLEDRIREDSAEE